MNPPTHVAYADESSYTAHRFRSIAVVTLEAAQQAPISESLRQTLARAGVHEFKWVKLRQARDRFAAIHLVDAVLELALTGQLRVDVLIWDIQDSRHNIRGRDDLANLQRMYYHLFRNVLGLRWPPGSTWHLHPDENTAMDWQVMQDFLDDAGLVPIVELAIFNAQPFRVRLARDFSVLHIHEVASHETPLCQVADLFAGIGCYSHSAHDKYVAWSKECSKQLPLPLPSDSDPATTPPYLTNADRDRCAVIDHLHNRCKRHKLRVSLPSSEGFKTYDPAFPINFWTYEPQHPKDKAPVKA